MASSCRGSALRTAAVIRLLLHNGLRVDEACAADVADLGTDTGHRVLRVIRKGARKARIPLTPATVAALDVYLADRARRGWRSDARQLAGPLLATASGGRLRQGHLWELVRRLARDAGIQAWDQLSRIACGTRRSPSRSTSARPSAMSRTTPAARIRAQLAGTTTPGTAWTATPPTRSRPTLPDRNHSGRPSVARPVRYGLEPIRHGRRGRSWRGRQRFRPSRPSRSTRPIRPRRHGRSSAGSTSSSTGNSAAIAASGPGNGNDGYRGDRVIKRVITRCLGHTHLRPGDSGRCHELPCMRPGSCDRRPERESVETAIAADAQVGASGKPRAARDITVDPYRCNA